MGKNDIDALLDFYLFSDLEDEKAVEEYLEEECIDFDSFYDDIGLMLKRKKAEIKIEKGKKLKEEYGKKLQELMENWKTTGNRKEELRYAFRKMEELSDEELSSLADDDKKLELLKILIQEKGIK